MPRIETDDGVRLHWVESGPTNALPLLLSNSLGTSLEMWAAQAAALSDVFRVIRYDSRGHGESDAPDGPYSLERLGRDALCLMDALGLEHVRFCGLSLGGMVGQWLGIHAPERVERLVLANTASHLGPVSLWQDRIALVRRSGLAALAETALERWFTPEFRIAQPEAIARARAVLLKTPPQGYAGCCAAIRDMDLRAQIGAIDRPTLVIGGSRDPATPPDLSRALADGIAGARLAYLDAAHLSNIEQSQAFTALLRDFLAEQNTEITHA